GVLAAELEDVTDLDGPVRPVPGAARRAGAAGLRDDDVHVRVDLEVPAGDDVLRVGVGLVGARDPGGARRHARVGEVADLLQALRADVAADQVGAGREVRLRDQLHLGGREVRLQLAHVDLAVTGHAHG